MRDLAGTVTVAELVDKVGVSRANVRRFARDARISLRKMTYSQQLIAQVLDYYAEYGKSKTLERFPNIKLRTIVEHRTHKYSFAARQTRFTDDDVRLLARMAALVPYSLQAKHLGRPNANAGSIRSFWAKRMPCASSAMQGLPKHWAKYICEPDVPSLKLAPVQSEAGQYGLTLVLWCDAALYLRPEVPPFLQDAVKTMATFQQWLYESESPQLVIHDIVEWSQSISEAKA